jgi:homoserine acetyltransferase
VSATAPLSVASDAPQPRRLAVTRDALVIDGCELAGYATGPALGTAPVVVVTGGITATPFPFTGDDAWWPALAADGLIDPDRPAGLAPCWPGSSSTWRSFAEVPLPPLSAAGLADLIAAWLDGIGATAPVWFVGASPGGMVGAALAMRHPELHRELVAAGVAASLWTLPSGSGHDAFLADQARLAALLRDAGCFAAGRCPR